MERINKMMKEQCTTAYDHKYAEFECFGCGVVFCCNCCGWQNVDQSGKHNLANMMCPECGKNALDMEE